MKETDKHEAKSESSLKRHCVVASVPSPAIPVCHLSIWRTNNKTCK